MWDQVGQLYAYHGDVPAEVRLLKLTEEVGEVAEAFIGMQPQPGQDEHQPDRPQTRRRVEVPGGVRLLDLPDAGLIRAACFGSTRTA
jgi:hypothetical protein